MYAVVHSATYRARYDAAIRVDFARVPIAASPALLRGLAALGAELIGAFRTLIENPVMMVV